jgi:hypothetical protein
MVGIYLPHPGRKVIVPMVAALWLVLAPVLSALAADWPQYCFDAGRTAACPQPLPAERHPLWERQLPAPRPAFPGEIRLRYDATMSRWSWARPCSCLPWSPTA